MPTFPARTDCCGQHRRRPSCRAGPHLRACSQAPRLPHPHPRCGGQQQQRCRSAGDRVWRRRNGCPCTLGEGPAGKGCLLRACAREGRGGRASAIAPSCVVGSARAATAPRLTPLPHTPSRPQGLYNQVAAPPQEQPLAQAAILPRAPLLGRHRGLSRASSGDDGTDTDMPITGAMPAGGGCTLGATLPLLCCLMPPLAGTHRPSPALCVPLA